ncbi:hypothetical protein EJ08DRAFT_649554 [Tothia fuscella]|uniref:Septation initiation network scaffold protein cdc11 n=1 Tax=Tothia fuscella TaxID=1048955 RepID=A0A9P4NSJ2_9PEZI|nr:hypothetical protein EJ08DRAFT_649554 [Tothia fuscella]
MSEWLEDLSEDWEPQPASEASRSVEQKTAILRNSATRGTSGSSRRKSVLTERSFSAENIQFSTTRRNEDKVPRVGLSRRSLSAESNQSVVQNGTTARVSPPKQQRHSDTPEWKRRLLKGEMGYGEQKDLFGPTGIQNIFQRPEAPPQQSQKEKPRGLSFLQSLEHVPSSPPVWSKNEASGTSPSRNGTAAARDLDVLDEQEEDGAQSHKSLLQESENTNRPELHELDNDYQQSDSNISLDFNGASIRDAQQSHGSIRGGTAPRKSIHSLNSQRNQPTSRTTSHGQSFQSNGSDDFSPVFISKHNTADGRVDYAAIDLSRSALASRIREIAESRTSERPRDARDEPSQQSAEFSLSALERETLPEDLPVGTPEIADIGDYVSIKRGGYSQDGSFRRRPLSPSPLARPVSVSTTEGSVIHRSAPEPSSLEASSFVRPEAPTPPQDPTTPKRNVGENQFLSPQRNKSNSPLKLFGNHDTFTTNKLHRRISQLEDSIHQAQNHDDSETGNKPRSRRTTGGSRLPSVEEASFAQGQVALRLSDTAAQRNTSINGYFGEGDLDEYNFPEEQFSSGSGEMSELSHSLPSRSPSPDVLAPRSQQPFRFHVEESPEPEAADTFRGKRKLSKVSAKSTLSTLSVNKRGSVRGTRHTLDAQFGNPDLSRLTEVSVVSEGKRPPTSPFKNPTPKRRRTLVQIEVQEPSLGSVNDSHLRFQSAIGKRKDARYDSRSNVADPEVLARRTILRPRNPTPSQRRRMEIEDEIYNAAEEFLSSSPRLEAIKEHLSVPMSSNENLLQAQAVASEVAAFSERVAQGMKSDGRKKSVTTQDFLDEAMKIMSFIRNKGRPNSGLNSVQEFDSEMFPEDQESQHDDQPEFDETPLSLSRPPSREGMKSAWRSRHPDNVAPEVLDHLRRFQESEDDVFGGASLRASKLVKEASRPGSNVHTIESHPPGLHIIGRSPQYESRKRSRSQSNATRDGHHSTGTEGTVPSHSSQTSMDSSLGRTTGSRKSVDLPTLGPDKVAHLIPEEVAGMTFDREKGIWIKMKSPKKPNKVQDEPSSVSQSENDPFDDIPDLTVDEAEETRHLMSRSGGGSDLNKSDDDQPAPEHPIATPNAKRGDGKTGLTESKLQFPLPPGHSDLKSMQATVTRESSGSTDDSSTTRAPSQNSVKVTPAKPKTIAEAYIQHQPAKIPEKEDVEHEIKINEGRSFMDETCKRRHLHGITVSISSPPPSRHQSTSTRPIDASISKKDFAKKQSGPESPFRPKAHDPRQMSLSVRVSAPITTTVEESEQEPSQLESSPFKAEMTFYMSDLPDFTVNQIDERELPDRAVTLRNKYGRITIMEDRFASGNHLLVKALQDVEPQEPYWEDLRQVDLHGKVLTSLHLLDMLCPRLEKVNIADNEICQLGGVPSSIRCLSAQGNQLTSLTSWGHLMNLQYLDVSNNDIDSLDGFGGLMHLRELRADGNRITNLDGIAFLDGLLTLSLRNNQLQEVDFEGTELTRLKSVDLRGNGMTMIKGLHCLPALKELNLDDNALTSFPTDNQRPLPLTSLSLQNNNIHTIDLAPFAPKLQRLHLDGNHLASTSGFSQLKHLRVLTLRSQTPDSGPCDLDPLLTSSMRELHTLCLSQNHITTLSIPLDFTSIRHLEIADCGLDTLPSDFGLSIPNLRTLNLNFNAIKDIRPFLNIRRLNTLLLAGNRLSRLRKTAAVLSKLTSLETLDLRDNPLSQGFYPRAVEQRLIPLTSNTPQELSNQSSKNQDDDEIPIFFTLPPCDKDADSAYLNRIDEGTKLRRRVYELLCANYCKRLAVLDGMAFVRGDVLVKDGIWGRLLELGVVRKSERGGGGGVDVVVDV